MTSRWEVEKAVKASGMEPTGRHIMLTLLSEANASTAEIPPSHAPSYTDLEKMTGLSRSALIEWMTALTNAGWVSRKQIEGEPKTAVALSVGESKATRPPRRRASKPATTPHFPTPRKPTSIDAAYRQAVQGETNAIPPGGTNHTAERYDTVPPGGTVNQGHLIKNSPTESSTTNSTLTPPLFAEDAPPAPKKRAPKPRKPETYREDVERICAHLAKRVIANGSAAKVTDSWRREARLLLDEKRPIPVTVEKVIALIDWCQADDFWAPNIRCMKTFRKQYDGLRLRALNEYKQGRRNGGLGSNGHQPYRNPTDHSEYDDWTVVRR
jgi:hypothetical protein